LRARSVKLHGVASAEDADLSGKTVEWKGAHRASLGETKKRGGGKKI